MRKQKEKRPVRREGANSMFPKPKPARLMTLVVGNAYFSRKGSATRMQWGNQSVFMVLEVPARCTTVSIIKVLGPNGLLFISAGDLRPAVDTSEATEVTE